MLSCVSRLKRSALSGRSVTGGAKVKNAWRFRLVDPDETPVPVRKGEYALLLAFLEAPQRPLTCEYLLQATRTGSSAGAPLSISWQTRATIS